MSGILFLILAPAAIIVTAWRLGLFSGYSGTLGTPDYRLAGLSFTAAIIFAGLALAGRVHRKEAKSSVLFD